MKQHEFEELWLKREELDEPLRGELEQFARSNPSVKSFVEGGWKVHQLLKGQEGAVAEGGFAYRMKVYATNHMDEAATVQSERGAWLRWPAVSGGLVAGVMLVLFGFGPFTSTVVPVADEAQTAPQVIERPAATEAPVQETQLAQEEIPAQVEDSVQAVDPGPRVREPQPHWDLRTVGTGGATP